MKNTATPRPFRRRRVVAGLGALAALLSALLLASCGSDVEVEGANFPGSGSEVPGVAINLAGPVITVAGISGNSTGSDGSPGTTATFNSPHMFATDGTDLFIPEFWGNEIRRMNLATTNVTIFAGTTTPGTADGTGTAARFNLPGGIVFVGGFLYLADFSNNAIRRMNPSSAVVTTFAGTGVGSAIDGPGASATFQGPHALATDGSNLYVADQNNHRIRKIVLATAVVSTIAGSTGGYLDGVGAAAQFSSPKGVAYLNGYLYVADTNNNRVRRIDLATNNVTTLAGSAASGLVDNTNGLLAQFNVSEGITTDGVKLYVADSGNNAIRMIDPSTTAVSTVTGFSAAASVLDGTLATAQFRKPVGIIVVGDALYVSDFDGHTIRRID